MTERIPAPPRDQLYAHFGQLMLKVCTGCHKAPVPLCRCTPHFYCPYCKMLYQVPEETVQDLFKPKPTRPEGCVDPRCLPMKVCHRHEACGCAFTDFSPSHCMHCSHSKACHRA